MANPLYGMTRGYGSPQPPSQNFMQKFMQFMQTFKGNPQQKVQDLLRNGQMTQEQFEQFSAIADQIAGKRSS